MSLHWAPHSSRIQTKGLSGKVSGSWKGGEPRSLGKQGHHSPLGTRELSKVLTSEHFHIAGLRRAT